MIKISLRQVRSTILVQVSGGRRPPRYPIHYWNIRERLTEGLPRTNNQVEGFHRGVQACLDCDRPSYMEVLKICAEGRSPTDGSGRKPESRRRGTAREDS